MKITDSTGFPVGTNLWGLTFPAYNNGCFKGCCRKASNDGQIYIFFSERAFSTQKSINH